MASIISSECIKDGMILHDPVINKNGQVLLGAGKVLSVSFQRILKLWGIATIVIESDDQSNESSKEKITYSVEAIELAKTIVEQKIKWKPYNTFEQELIDIAISIYVKEVA